MTRDELLKLYSEGQRDFSRANLSGADLSSANLSGANLSGANLSGADLYGAYLSRAKLSRANLSSANLYGANLSSANLYGAYLSRANLSRANLYGAYLSNTILDPRADVPHPQKKVLLTAGFVIEGDFVIGWRTAQSQHCGEQKYEAGRCYAALVFSVDQFAPCHPGLYLAPKKWLLREYPDRALVRVAAVWTEIVHAGDKWRTRRLLVLPEED